jgi:hypothetical protein
LLGTLAVTLTEGGALSIIFRCVPFLAALLGFRVSIGGKGKAKAHEAFGAVIVVK